MSDVKRMPVSEFRGAGYLQEANRLFFHPVGLALEVTVMDSDSDDEGMQRRVLPAVERALVEWRGHPLTDLERAAAREVAREVVAEVWPRGIEHISGVWDYREDPEGVVFGDWDDDAEGKRRTVQAERDRHRAARSRLLDNGAWDHRLGSPEVQRVGELPTGSDRADA